MNGGIFSTFSENNIDGSSFGWAVSITYMWEESFHVKSLTDYLKSLIKRYSCESCLSYHFVLQVNLKFYMELET